MVYLSRMRLTYFLMSVVPDQSLFILYNLSASEVRFPAVFAEISPPKSLFGGVPIATGVGLALRKESIVFAILIAILNFLANFKNLLVLF